MFRIILVLTLSMLSAAAQDFFPLVPGSQWVYRTTQTEDSLTLKMGAERQIAGNTYVELRGYAPETLHVRRTADNTFVYWDAVAKIDQPFLDFAGNDFPSIATECKQTAKVQDRQEPYRGPLGEFPLARTIAYAGGMCADAGLNSETFVANLGMARRTITTIAGPRDFDLVYAQIGGVTYVTDAQVAFTMTLAELPTINRNRPLTVRLILDNRTASPLELTFPSSQRFDFQLKDSRGEVVHTWSASRIFLPATETVAIVGEQVWQAEIPLEGLRPGVYTLEGNLTNNDGKRYAAVASFDLK
ncbi:MAG: BsuPI-related putative proteinase inhibitor [Bryobacter sp.]|nr:BsuPI-related putative proteinase inhibitor [Bryobacter sp.]